MLCARTQVRDSAQQLMALCVLSRGPAQPWCNALRLAGLAAETASARG